MWSNGASGSDSFTKTRKGGGRCGGRKYVAPGVRDRSGPVGLPGQVRSESDVPPHVTHVRNISDGRGEKSGCKKI